jgi:UDP-N-acetylmuramate dehydrogenase
MTDITGSLKIIFGPRLKENEPMAKYTNFRIGGAARWLAEARSEDEIRGALRVAKENGVPVFVLGGGSNTLANDKGFDGLVVKVAMRATRIEGTRVHAEAGVLSAGLARTTGEAGLAGLEWAISLPGTVGGGVRGNAGCYGGEMGDRLVSARVLRDGQIVEMSKADFQFAYRESALKHSQDIVLSADFELEPGDPKELKTKMEGFLAKRKASQPLYAGSAGCIFKNYEVKDEAELSRLKQEADIPEAMLADKRISAGWIIDQLDLKGKTVGGAQISPEHGNFVINTGNATASDVVQLIAIVKTAARDRFGIQLQEEVQYLGF